MEYSSLKIIFTVLNTMRRAHVKIPSEKTQDAKWPMQQDFLRTAAAEGPGRRDLDGGVPTTRRLEMKAASGEAFPASFIFSQTFHTDYLLMIHFKNMPFVHSRRY